MKTPILYNFCVETPTPDDPTLAMVWIGGPLKPSKTQNKVWLTNPSGEKVLEAEKSKIHPLTKEQVAQSILDETKRAQTLRDAIKNS